MTELSPVDPDWNVAILNLNTIVAAEMVAAGHRMMMARGEIGSNSRSFTVLIAVDEESEVLQDSAVDLLKTVSKRAYEARQERKKSASDPNLN